MGKLVVEVELPTLDDVVKLDVLYRDWTIWKDFEIFIKNDKSSVDERS